MRIVGVAAHPDDETSGGTMTGRAGPSGEVSVHMLTAQRLDALGHLDKTTPTTSPWVARGEH